jgi:hypothetical protein
MTVALPHEVERLGPAVQSWVEQQLLRDLRHYGAQRDDVRIDWSQVVQEGHWMDFRGRMVESLSDVIVRAPDGSIVAEGWMDFVITSEATDSEPKLFWLFLSVEADGKLRKAKEDALLPVHLWESMTEAEKQYVAATESKWLDRDPKVQAWRRRQQLTNG